MFRNSAMVALAALVLSAGAAAAQSNVEVGVLTCSGPTTTYFVASRKDMDCLFRRSDGVLFPYKAKVVLVGVDVGAYQTASIQWGVIAPTRNVHRADLVGNYGGISAGGSIGIGIGGNLLFGGSNNTMALQPMSVQGQTGWGVAAGIASLELYAVEGAPRRRGRRR